ncbi:hypothetical protein V6N13_110237 [Hibiscus sabdariffa]|uniref:FIST C-domain domain-containing protein n=2 Tax=Hibiscus sabdariffa TaxID=183260 RepID=A0ABR2AER7_9ROSI
MVDTPPGDVEFHCAVSNGVVAIGPRLRVISTELRGFRTNLAARREGQAGAVDRRQMVLGFKNEREGKMDIFGISIGFTKIELLFPRGTRTTVELHKVLNGNPLVLHVDSANIREGDTFQFYVPDLSTALSSSNEVSSTLKNLKSKSNVVDKTEAFGGFIFARRGRGESFFGQPNVDSSLFLDNFPGIPVAGILCSGDVGRGYMSITANGEERPDRSHLLHAYSTLYLLMSYTPSP